MSPDYPGFTYFTQVWLCAVRQGVRHLFGPRLPLTNKVRYIMSGSRRGERGKMCPFTGTEGTKDTLEALEKGLKSERQAAQSRLARNTGCRRCSVGVHARPRLEFNWCDHDRF